MHPIIGTVLKQLLITDIAKGHCRPRASPQSLLGKHASDGFPRERKREGGEGAGRGLVNKILLVQGAANNYYTHEERGETEVTDV